MDDVAIAEAILTGIKELIELYEAHKSGNVSAQDVISAVQPFNDRIAANRKAAQDALDAKFDKGSTP